MYFPFAFTSKAMIVVERNISPAPTTGCLMGNSVLTVDCFLLAVCSSTVSQQLKEGSCYSKLPLKATSTLISTLFPRLSPSRWFDSQKI